MVLHAETTRELVVDVSRSMQRAEGRDAYFDVRVSPQAAVAHIIGPGAVDATPAGLEAYSNRIRMGSFQPRQVRACVRGVRNGGRAGGGG